MTDTESNRPTSTGPEMNDAAEAELKRREDEAKAAAQGQPGQPGQPDQPGQPGEPQPQPRPDQPDTPRRK